MTDLLTPEERALELKRLVGELQAEGRKDLLLHAIGVPLLVSCPKMCTQIKRM